MANREIRFRGKRTNNGEWVYGSLLVGFTGINYIIVMHDHILSMTEMYEVDEKTVGQLTGLKDKSGKEIYEGDALVIPSIQTPYEQENDIAVLEFKNGCPCYKINNRHECIWNYIGDCDKDEEAEVIGNIYGNSELLKP